MLKFKRHIVIILLGLFVFPIVFQSLHIVWHHSHDYKCNHILCHIQQTGQNIQAEINTASQKDNHCPICEYQFSINDLPKIFLFSTNTLLIDSFLKKLELQFYFQQLITIKSPRAPPA